MEFYAILVFVLLIIILYKQSNRFGKLDSEICELKKRVDTMIKIQEESLSVKVEEEQPEEESDVREIYVAEPLPEPAELYKEELYKEEVPAVQPLRKEKKSINYEKFIGENLFGKIGILVLVVGIGLFVKYAIDRDWINETMRTILGFVAGSILLFIAERLREKYRTFSSLLAGGAFAVFYLTVAIAFHYYHLFPQTVAFVILVCITVFMSALAILYDRRELAVVSLVGGFIAPFLVSSGDGNYLVLFTYLAILNLGMFGLSLYKKWAELPMISFAFTYVVLFAYVLNQFILTADGVVGISVARNLFIFATLFYFTFLLPVLSILKNENRKMNRFLLSIIVANNFIYLYFGSLFLDVMSLPFKADGLFTLFIAIVNLVLVVWLRRSKQDYKFLVYTMLGLVLTFVSITVPIQLNGNYITLFWASEMVLLLWLYTKSGIKVYEYASLILVGLTLVSFLMDAGHQITTYSSTNIIFLNSLFATSLFTGLAAAVYAFLLGRNREFLTTTRFLKYTPWNAIMLIASVAILYYTFMVEFCQYLNSDVAGKVMQLFTSACILAMCYGFSNRFPLKKCSTPYIIGMGLNVFLYLFCLWLDGGQSMTFFPLILPWVTAVVVIANLYYVGKLYFTVKGLLPRFTVYLNVIATLLWLAIVHLFLLQLGLPDEFNAGLSVALAIAGFVQMALGMRLHQKLLRIVSLATFGIVLVKLILVDLWSMPTVGKIIVFVILGVILLVLSFLYQKLKNVLFKNNNEESN